MNFIDIAFYGYAPSFIFIDNLYYNQVNKYVIIHLIKIYVALFKN